MNRKVNRDKFRLLTGAAGLVLGESHPTTQALARAITTQEPSDVTRARIGVRRLDLSLHVLLDDLPRRAGPRALAPTARTRRRRRAGRPNRIKPR